MIIFLIAKNVFNITVSLNLVNKKEDGIEKNKFLIYYKLLEF